MEVLVALVVIAAVAVLLATMRDARPEDGTDPPVDAFPRHGLRTAPDDWVTIGDAMKASEAAVVEALLESNGIRASLESSSHPATQTVVGHPVATGLFRLRVAPGDADTVRALLAPTAPERRPERA